MQLVWFERITVTLSTSENARLLFYNWGQRDLLGKTIMYLNWQLAHSSSSKIKFKTIFVHLSLHWDELVHEWRGKDRHLHEKCLHLLSSILRLSVKRETILPLETFYWSDDVLYGICTYMDNTNATSKISAETQETQIVLTFFVSIRCCLLV